MRIDLETQWIDAKTMRLLKMGLKYAAVVDYRELHPETKGRALSGSEYEGALRGITVNGEKLSDA